MVKVNKSNNVFLIRISSIVALIIAFTMYYFSVISIDLNKTKFLDLGPNPDAVEYVASAQNLLERCGFSVPFAGEHIPIRYPPGFPVLIAATSTMTRLKPIIAVFAFNKYLGLFLIVILFLFFYRKSMYIAAGSISLLLVSSPAFVQYVRSPLPEVVAAFILLSSAYSLCLFVKHRRRKYYYISIIMYSLSIYIKLQYIVFIIIYIPASYLYLLSVQRKYIDIIPLFVLVAILIAPMLLFNNIYYSSPLSTGYSYWVPTMSGLSAFNPASLSNHLESILDEFRLNSRKFDVANIFGPGSYFSGALLILVIISFVYYLSEKSKRNKLLVFMAPVLFLMCYRSISLRFYLVYIYAGIILTSLYLQNVYENFTAIKSTFRRYAIAGAYAMLFLGSALGFISVSGYPGKFDWFQSIPMMNKKFVGNRSLRYELAIKLKELMGDSDNVVVISEMNPVYLSLFINAPVLPSSASHSYRHSKIFKYGTKDIETRITESIINEKVIYYLSYGSVPNIERYAINVEYSWNEVYSEGLQARIYKMKYKRK